jgi:ATP-dependent Clp protease ATP-binding subunit ClpC
MFERYTEKARRTIFFARYEASQFGSPYIETEHLLLGLLREDKALTNRFLRSSLAVEEIRKQIESATTVREKVSTSVDLPLSNENKRVLAYAAEEAERLSDKHIGTEHLLLGLLREEKSFGAQLLHDLGLRISGVREELARSAHEGQAAPQTKETGLLADFSTYLTRMAKEGNLLPCVGREKEIEQVIHILGRSSKNNAVLVGDPGVGKRTITEGVVQRITGNVAPTFLREKLFAAIDLATVVAAAQHSARAKEFLDSAGAELATWGANTIFIFDELHALLAAGADGGAQEITLLLKSALLDGKVRCIALATPEDYRAAVKKARWLDRCFRAVEVQPPSEAEAIKILQGIKGRFEKFHSVQYAEDALTIAVTYSSRHVKNRSLPDKAIDLLDDAGAYVKMEQEAAVLPADVIENRKRISFVQQRLENAIANHEFEKARFYGDEERKEKAALQELEKKYNIRTDLVGTVTAAHVEEALARWTGMSLASIRESPAGAGANIEKQSAEQPNGGKKRKKKSS